MPSKHKDSNSNDRSSRLYTIICRYNEGTYVAQVLAETLPNAVGEWLNRELRSGSIPIPRDEFERIEAELASEVPIAIKDCLNAWAATAFPPSGPVWLDIVETATS